MTIPRRTLLYALLFVLAMAAPAAGQGGGAPPTDGTTPPPPAAQPVTTPTPGALYRNGQTGRFLLDGPWYFRADPQDQGLRAHLERQDSLDGWSPVTIPNAWNATDTSDQSDRGSIGWYRKDFNLPRAPHGTSWIVRFESVNYRTTVFLNGRQIGTHEGAFIPFELPGTSMKKGVNHLVVRVDNRRRSTDVPSAVDQANGRPGGGWWNYGGILREVYLREVRGVDIQNLLVRPTLPCLSCDAKVLFRATIANPAGKPKNVTVRATIAGRTARFRKVKVPGHQTRTVESTVSVHNPRLWQPGDPELYHARAQAFLGGRKASQYDADVGIRQIKVDNKGRMLLNGRQVQLRGASIHEDSPNNGMALTREQLIETGNQLQALGANVIRSHYPLNEMTLEMCDRRGIMVWEQIPFYRERFGNGDTALLSPDDQAARSQKVRAKALSFLQAAIDRDQNHPGVFAWSVANEPEPRPGDAEAAYFNAAYKLVHKLDPTRLAAVDLAGYPSMPQTDVYSQFDAVGLNTYFGWYPGPGGEVEDRTGLAPFLAEMHDYFPHSALFVTEFGAEANRDGPVDEKGTYAFQENLLDYHLDVYDKTPYLNGAIVWLLKDFRVQPGWDGNNPKPSPPVLKKGLMDEFGNKKPAFDDLAARFHDTPPFK